MLHERSPKLEIIADYACETGENPLWHPIEQRLYWTDIPTGRLFRFHPKTGSHEMIYHDRPVGGFTFQSDGDLLLFRDRGNVVLWREGKVTEIINEIPAERESRFNDVFADPTGRVFCGTMSSEQCKGRLYRLDTDGKLMLVLESIGCSNGMGFTPDFKGLYYTDSYAREIYLFDYNVDDGSLRNQRVFATLREPDGLPDGLTVDRNGRVWSAVWDGSALVRFDAEGQIDLRIHFPTRKITSLTFGGDDLRDIYVTSAGGNTKPEDGASAGALFQLRTGDQGTPEFFSKIFCSK